MTIRDKETLKSYFNRGDVPTEQNYADLIDSFFNAAELVLHASSHMYGGTDPIATFTPGAYLIPMAKADGKLDTNWFPQFTHASLANLGSDDHQQYVHISDFRTITAQHQFNPTSAIAPFTLGANARGQVVIGLRADELNKSVLAGDGLIGGNLLSSDVELSVNQGYGFNWTNQHIFNRPIIGAGIYPIQSDTYDIGNSDKLWRKGFFSELESFIFAKNTISIIGGWLMVSKGEGCFCSEVLPTDTIIDFGQNMTPNDFVIVRYNGEVEYIKVGSQVSGYTYNVTRDLDGTGAGKWSIGVPYVILGNTGDGRIELNATDTPRMSIIQQGSTYNSQTELSRIGDLNGGWGYIAETYGAAFGNYSGSGANVTIDPINGVRLRRGSTDVIKLTSTEATFKSLIKMPDTTSALAIGETPPTSSSVGTGLWIDRTGFYSLNANAKQLWIDATTGSLFSGGGNVKLDTDGISLSLLSSGLELNEAAMKWYWDSAFTIQAGRLNIRNTGNDGSGHRYFAMLGDVADQRIFSFEALSGMGAAYRVGYIDSNLVIGSSDTAGVSGLQVKSKALFYSGVRVGGGGIEWPQYDEILSGISSYRTRATNPSYNSASNKLFSKASSLFSLSQDNVPVNLSGAGNSGYLAPLTFYGLHALWLPNQSTGGTKMMVDLSPNHEHLAHSNMLWGQTKAAPGRIVAEQFNGTSSYVYRALNSNLAVSNWWTFGCWVYINSLAQNHGIVQIGTTTVGAWIDIYTSGTDKRWRFMVVDSTGVNQWITNPLITVPGWYCVQVFVNNAISGNNKMTLSIRNSVTNFAQSQTNVAWRPRTPVGNIEIGRVTATGPYYLNGAIACAYLAGEDASNLDDFYAATRGYFEY